MVVRKQHKRRRGERSYHGSHKKWRGGGSRGGRGQSGMHKHKWSYTVKYEPEHFGKFGFKTPQSLRKEIRTINVGDLEMFGKDKINLSEMGYEKLLGSGHIDRAVTVEAKSFSKSAIKKLEAAGGKAVQLKS